MSSTNIFLLIIQLSKANGTGVFCYNSTQESFYC